jgi:hypothetical protein
MKKSKKSNFITLSNIHKLNILLAILYLTQIIILVFVGHSNTVSITTNYLTSDQLLSLGNIKPVVATAIHHIYDVNLLYLIAILLIFSLCMRLVLLTTYRPDYEQSLKGAVHKARWVEYAVSTSLIMLVVTVLSGVYDVTTLIIMIVSIIFAGVLATAMELYHQANSKFHRSLFSLFIATSLIPWVVILIYEFGTHLLGNTGTAGYLYGLYASVAILSIVKFVYLYFEHMKVKMWANALYAEVAWTVVGFVMVSLVTWQVFAGALH